MTTTRPPVDQFTRDRDLGVAPGLVAPVRIAAPRPSQARARALAEGLGFDVAALERDGADRRAVMLRAADEERAAELAGSAGRAAQLSAELALLAQGPLRLSGVDGAPSSGFFAVDTPTRIFTTGGLQLDATSLVPFNSSARVIRPASSAFGIQEIVFAFPWVNSTAVDQVVTVTGVVGVNGAIEADDDGGFVPFGHDATRLSVRTLLRVFQGDDDSQEFTGVQTDGDELATVTAFEGGWPFSVGAIVRQSIVRGTSLQAVDQLIKAGTSRMFHLGVAVDNQPTDGQTSVDFSTGEQRVSGFALFVRVTS